MAEANHPGTLLARSAS
jgi:hypothetical protein